ncbi:MAG: COQ9 family protein [Alphaproteobacteria bacterium]|jgi:ubiquinone biosynthesis protein COQ9
MPPDPAADPEASREAIAILDAALPHVAFDGWSMAALRRGATDTGRPAEAADIAFPGGPSQAIGLWNAVCNARMVLALETVDLAVLKVRERIATAVRLRIEAYGGDREAVRRALSYLSTPGHARLATKLLYRTVDEIWYRCGDTATDFNFYTKRGLLAGVYTSTLMCWLDDPGDDHAETWAFLDRRIADALRIGSLPARLKKGWPGSARPPLIDLARFARRVATRLREGA